MKRLLSNFFKSESNIVEVTSSLVRLIRAKISRTTLEKEILSHPNFPSLLCISDVLMHHGIENITAEFEKGNYADLPTPFITQVTGDLFTYFTVIKNISKKQVYFFDLERHTWVKKSYTDFIKKVSGVVLLIKPVKNIKEQDYDKKISAERRYTGLKYFIAFCLPFITLLSGSLAYLQIGSGFILPFLFSLVLLIGLSITTLLLWSEIDNSNPVMQQICSGGIKSNCEAVLNSRSAIFGITWSAVGFVYFSGSLLSLLSIGMVNQQALTILADLNLLAAPFIFYSLLYQWRVAKQWCKLCLAVQVVLSLLGTISLLAGWQTRNIMNSFNGQISIQLFISFTFPILLTGILFPALKKNKESQLIKRELQRLKNDPAIFDALLDQQKKLTEEPKGMGITLGNPDARYKIIKVCNPFCSPCARMHKQLEELIKENSSIQLQLIFTASNFAGDSRAAPVKHLLAINDQKDSLLISEALDDWYVAKYKDYNAFAAKYPMNGELNKQGIKLYEMHKWCINNKIQFTPTLFINGRQLPINYNIEDLKYLLAY